MSKNSCISIPQAYNAVVVSPPRLCLPHWHLCHLTAQLPRQFSFATFLYRRIFWCFVVISTTSIPWKSYLVCANMMVISLLPVHQARNLQERASSSELYLFISLHVHSTSHRHCWNGNYNQWHPRADAVCFSLFCLFPRPFASCSP